MRPKPMFVPLFAFSLTAINAASAATFKPDDMCRVEVHLTPAEMEQHLALAPDEIVTGLCRTFKPEELQHAVIVTKAELKAERERNLAEQQATHEAMYGKTLSVTDFIYTRKAAEFDRVEVVGLIHCSMGKCYLHDPKAPLTSFVLLDTAYMEPDDLHHAALCKLADTKHCSVTIQGRVELINNPHVPGIDPTEIEWPE
jgi:hypothetical protein